MEEQKKRKFGFRKLLSCLGIVVFVLGIVFLVGAINDYNKAVDIKNQEYQQKLQQYQKDYDEWYDQWFGVGNATLNDKPKRPVKEIVEVPAELFLYALMMFGGIIMSSVGFISLKTKDIIIEPIDTIQTIAGAMGTIKNMHANIVKMGEDIDYNIDTNIKTEEKPVKFVYCKYCGSKNKETEVECPNCGSNLK